VVNRLLIVCVLILFLGSTYCAELPPHTDEEGIIRLLHIGKAWFRPNHPAPVIAQDPRIRYLPVPSNAWTMGEEALRNLRLYLPRSYELLFENFDVILEDGMDAALLSDDFHHWMARGVQEEGMGFLMVDDSSSFASGRHTSWYLFPIGDVLPVTDAQEIWYPEHGYHVIVEQGREDHPLVANIPWNTMPKVWAHNRPTEKEGAIVLARMSPELVWNRNKPVICYWDYGKGRSLAYVHKWHGTPNDPGGDIPGNEEFYRWKWHVDLVSHLIYFPARVSIPDDLGIVHQIRVMFNSFRFQKLYLISSMEFADKFGANLVRVESRLAEALEEKESIDRLYLSQDLERCSDDLMVLMAHVEALIEEVLEAKDRAMLWIFVVEWLIVSGTSMVAGFLLWTLMVRRRLYREVQVTKLIES
jgi:hypothetical protein